MPQYTQNHMNMRIRMLHVKSNGVWTGYNAEYSIVHEFCRHLFFHIKSMSAQIISQCNRLRMCEQTRGSANVWQSLIITAQSHWQSSCQLFFFLFQVKVKAKELRGKKKEELVKHLDELKTVSTLLIAFKMTLMLRVLVSVPWGVLAYNWYRRCAKKWGIASPIYCTWLSIY